MASYNMSADLHFSRRAVVMLMVMIVVVVMVVVESL
jgi:hypothetical protein